MAAIYGAEHECRRTARPVSLEINAAVVPGSFLLQLDASIANVSLSSLADDHHQLEWPSLKNASSRWMPGDTDA
jgi:hypothetical protein